MELEFIPLAQVLKQIHSGETFDIEVATCDVRRGTGGKLMAYPKCIKHLSQTVKSTSKLKAATNKAPKNPNHQQNSTINLYLTQLREVRTVHIRLITRFNGKLVS